MATTPIHDVGSSIGPYRIEELLGRGGMGVVYRATDLRLGRPVALKLLSPELSGDARFRARFERESHLAASIDHAGIIPVYEAGETDGLLYIAMRYVDGSDLAQLLRREGPLEPTRAIQLVGQLAEALDAAHARGLIHRDVKPSNVLVTREGPREHVYLADFGLTRTNSPDSVTASGQLMGTVSYMAPEVIRGEQPDSSADVYALGCVLFECLTGEVPFSGSNEAAVIYGHLETPPPSAHDRAARLPVALDPMITRALAKDPPERYDSGAAMMAAARVALGAAPAGRSARRGRRLSRRAVLIGAAALALAGAAVAASWPDADSKIAAIRNDAVAVIDPEERSLRAQVPLDSPPSAVAAAAGAIWVADARNGSVSRIDPATHTVRQTVSVGRGQSVLAAGRDGVWAANRQDGTISLISAATNTVVDKFTAGSPTDVCLLDGDVWVAGASPGAVLRRDPDTRRERRIPVGTNTSALACGAGGVWAVGDRGRLVQINPATNLVRHTLELGAGASVLAAGDEALWVANPLTDTVSRVDPGRGVVTATVTLRRADEPVALAVGAGGVWAANRRARTLTRIDPERAVEIDRFPLGNEPRGLTVVDGRLWVAVTAAGAGHRGGTLHVAFQGEPFDRSSVPDVRAQFDPATGYGDFTTVLSLGYDGLTALRRVGGTAGLELVPNLAEAIPMPSDGGRTYTFTVRDGVRFSTGGRVRPSDIKRGIERSLNGKQAAFGVLDGIESVAADDANRTIVIRLKQPDPDFPYRLAWPFASPVPPGTAPPPSVVASTGPYRIARFEPPRVRLERNRFYRTWSTLARPDGYPDAIDIRLGVSADKAIKAVRAGRTDVTYMMNAPAELADLRRRDPGLIRDSVPLVTSSLYLNTRVAPFDRPDARRAVALAIDREAVVAAGRGEYAARPTCHLLPPTFPGYRPDCAPRDLAAARRLVARSGTRGARVVLRVANGYTFIATPLAGALRSLGYRTSVRVLSIDTGAYFNELSDSSVRAQAGPVGWGADYPAPSAFLNQFTCRAFLPRSTSNSNFSQFCDPGADALIRQATALQASDPRAADARWAQAERRVLETAPAIPLFNNVHSDLLSARVGNDQYHPQWGLMFDQLWVG
jgi:ABC-type transport system substrate-binding protein/DNA-binding beta-propeller fold protein YncE